MEVKDLIALVSTLGTALGVVAALLSFGFSLVARWRERLLRARAPKFIDLHLGEPSSPRTLEEDARLGEARASLSRQQSTARWNRRAAASLTFGQYVVGGVLATSFIQESLPKEAIGALGVLVLISSLIHQRYRPDIQARGALDRATQLRRLIRNAEDALFSLSRGGPQAPTIHEIRAMVSDGLTRIEEAEVHSLDDLGTNGDGFSHKPNPAAPADAAKAPRG